MKILLTNDDGIRADGLAVLWSELKKIAEVIVVAPDRERSATGHGITMDIPLRAEKISLFDDKAWAVNGTPADCVKLAVNCLLDDSPDLVIAGINRGSNLGVDIFYSGTVSGALEGTILGFPAIAVSVTEYSDPDYRYAASFMSKLVPKVPEANIGKDTLVNINVPSLTAEEIRGVKITRLGSRKYINSFETRVDPRGKSYYWLGGDVVDNNDNREDTDVACIQENMVSVTPIQVDLTNYRVMDSLKDFFDDLSEGQRRF
ncbi:MAG: 5'/3'-nucleotidase SurE [Syntrophaceticus sp.]|nr:5'/3'-nucleotidase SurE [Syntrophaceticus sp.]MDD3314877.1 5'/3'-nucleotidase SurE [Syntrophaceticus sp.]MDD4359201.1 5'/3'-nucleotidase SurE [Syntrophaceticus sp.]MDD4782043.1 5'/3'-nucleotidase SurE [Syntrophaceticus sp.]HBG22543.1 5'/3'-nucleotidase SurE [Peptococcaceae bacterium]